MSIFVILGLLVCIEATGSSAVTPVFVQKGDDLLLNVTDADVPQRFIIVAWKIGENILVTFSPDGEPTVSDVYTGRVETSVNKFSVKLKNVQEADSGVYTARVIAQKEITLSEYNVTVQGSQPSPHSYVITSVVVPVAVVLILIISAGGFYLRRRGKNKRENIENTIYAVPEAHQQGDHSPHEMGATAKPAYSTNDASGPSPVSEYSIVGLHSGSTETRGKTLPESLYAQIDRPVGRAAKRQEN